MDDRSPVRHSTGLRFAREEDPLPVPAFPRSSDGFLSEAQAPYVRYSPAPSSSSELIPSSSNDGRNSVASDHDSFDGVLRAILIPTARLPQNRAVCNLCKEDFQTHQEEQMEPLEPLRKLPCSHVFHDACIAQLISHWRSQDEEASSFYDFDAENLECPTCRRPLVLPLDYCDGPSELGHPSLHLFSESPLRPLLRRPPTERNRTRLASQDGPDEIPVAEVRSQGIPSRTQGSLAPVTADNSGSESPLRSETLSESPQRPREPFLSTPSAPISGIPSLSKLPPTSPRPRDQLHLCRLWNPLKPTISAPRRPCIPEESAPHVEPTMRDCATAQPAPGTNEILECTICNHSLVHGEPREREETADRASTTSKSLLREAGCGHVFHANCLDFLTPSCECQLLTGYIECPICAHPIPLKSLGLDSVEAMINHSAAPPANMPRTWFRELLRDNQLLAASRHSTNLKRLRIGRGQRFVFKLQAVCFGRPHFEGFLRDMQEKGLISFNAGSLQGPEGLWGHHISVSAAQDSTLSGNLVGETIWGVQRTAEKAKDAAALKVLRRFRGDDLILE